MAQSTSLDSGVHIELAQLFNFIDELRESGYNIGTSQYMAVQDLLLALHGRIDLLKEPARLKLMLGPLLCTTPSEQAEFSHRFDQWLVQLDAQRLSQSKPADYQANLDELEKIARSAFRWSVVLRVLLILLVPVIIGEGSDPGRGRHEIGEIASEIVEAVETVETVETTTAMPSFTRQPVVQASPQPRSTLSAVTGGEEEGSEIDAPLRMPRKDIELGYARLFLIGLLAALVYGVRQFWWRYNAQRFLSRHSTADSPTIHRLRVQHSNSLLFAPLQLSHIARDFRRRTDEPSSSIHILRTVDKTLRAGGWLTPVYRRRHALPEYLMLVDRVSLRDHQSQYVTELITLLQEQGVFTVVFYFDGDPRRCVPENEQEPPSSLEEIIGTYGSHRLVLITDASGLFNSLTGLPEPWLEIFSNIPDRSLLTPVPVMHWGYREQALAEQFIVLPATTDGLSILVEQLQRGQQAGALIAERKPPLPTELQHRPLRWLEREPPPPPLVERILFELKAYLGSIGYTWLCACAVYPGLDWNMTLYLGHIVSGATRGQQLASERVLDLARLPWFRYGYMPDWLRILLIGSLPGQSEQRIRRALDALLISAIQGGDGGFALEIAQNESPFISRLGRSLHQLLGHEVAENNHLQEHVYMNFMAGRKRQLAVQLPEPLAKALFTRRFFRDGWQFGLRWLGANLLGYAGLGLLIFVFIFWQGFGEFTLISGLSLGFASGALLGFCQYLAIRSHIPVDRSWIWMTTIGVGLVTAVLGIIILITNASSAWFIFAAMTSQFLISPIVQSGQLRPFTPNPRRWLWVSVAGWTLGGLVGVLGSVPLLGISAFGILGLGVTAFLVSIGIYSLMTGSYLWHVSKSVEPLFIAESPKSRNVSSIAHQIRQSRILGDDRLDIEIPPTGVVSYWLWFVRRVLRQLTLRQWVAIGVVLLVVLFGVVGYTSGALTLNTADIPAATPNAVVTSAAVADATLTPIVLTSAPTLIPAIPVSRPTEFTPIAKSIVPPTTETPTAPQDDEIIYIDAGRFIRVIDPNVASKMQPITWSSPDNDWYDFATGDFDNDGDKEIVAIGGDRLTVFDPVVRDGTITPDGEYNRVPWVRLYERSLVGADIIGAGNLDQNSPGDEILVGYNMNTQEANGTNYRLEVLKTDDGGRTWTTHVSQDFSAKWTYIKVGNIDNQGSDDLLMGRTTSVDSLVEAHQVDDNFATIYSREDSTLFTQRDGAIGQIYAGGTGETILLRTFNGTTEAAAMLIYQFFNGAWQVFEDPNNPQADDSAHYFPHPFDVVVGDVNGNGDDEIIWLREAPNGDSVIPRLVMVNRSADVLPGFETSLDADNGYRTLAMGDPDGNGRDDVAVMRNNRIRVFTSVETGNASLFDDYSVDTNGRSLNFANLDGDGYLAN